MIGIAAVCWLGVALVSPSYGPGASAQGTARIFRIVPGLSQASYAVHEVFLRQLKSDSDRRDRALHEKYLATHRFPHGDTLRGVARAQVKMSEFGIEVPRLLSLRSADDVKLEIRVVAVVTSSPSLP